LEYALVEEGMDLNIGNDFLLDDVDNIFSYTLRMFLYAEAYHDKEPESVLSDKTRGKNLFLIILPQ